MAPPGAKTREKRMTILKKSDRIWHKDTEIRNFCIQTIRFKKLLENATALLDLFEDGNEKLTGEYILDRHYVTSLVDDIIEKSGMIVYDACTLAPENGQALYALYDQHKRDAQKLIRENSGDAKNDPPANGAAIQAPLLYPEYRLLADVLIWFNGENEDMTVMDLMKQALFTGIVGIESMENIKNEVVYKGIGFEASNSCIYFLDLWKDPIASPEHPRSPEDIDSIPLKRLFTAALNSGLSSSATLGPTNAIWVAASSEYGVSLNTLTSHLRFRLDAVVSGNEKSDYIFIFADNRIDTNQILPSGFRMEKTTDGCLAWKRNTSAAAIEDDLMTIGRNLFCANTGQC
jgi:hypothetical protein